MFSIIVLSLTSLHHVSGDGCWHANAGRFIAKNSRLPLFEPLGRDEPFWSPPLYHIIAAGVYYFFSAFNNEIANFAVKFISPVFGVLSLIFSFLLIRKIYSSKIAFYSTVFIAFLPIFLDYGIFSYVDGMLTFFVILSVYLLIENKVVLSGVAAGLAILIKYNGIFILPVLAYITYKRFNDKKIFYRNIALIVLLPLLISAPWLIRNWILLGNPIWPFLNFIFNGVEAKSFTDVRITNIIHPDLYIFTYLGLFGVPDGNYNTLFFFDIPYIKILLFAWLAGTIIFIIPLILGFFSKNIDKKRKGLFVIWFCSYLILFFLYAINVGFSVSGIILPAIPAFALFWALGFERLIGNKKLKNLLKIFILIAAGFVIVQIFKITVAANAWDFYKDDFEWVKSNTKPDSLFIANGQCIPYNIERTSVYANEENLKKADYVWVNQEFGLDRRSVLDEKTLDVIEGNQKLKVVYSNNKTKTKVYGTESR